MTLHDPPESLAVEFDLHGIRCGLRPRAERSFGVRVFLGTLSGLLTVGGLGGFMTGLIGFSTMGDSTWLGLSVASMLLLLLLLAMTVIDSAEQLDRFDVRLGEGWLALRFADQGSEIRLDLTAIRKLAIDGADIELTDDAGEIARVPMGGHTPEEVQWLAKAIDAAILDARHGDMPAPDDLMNLLSRAPNE